MLSVIQAKIRDVRTRTEAEAGGGYTLDCNQRRGARGSEFHVPDGVSRRL